MNKEQLIIEITKELQLYNNVSTHTMGNISDLIDKYTDTKVNKISVKPDVSGMLSLAEVEKFIWEIGEDYHLWDEEAQGTYPIKRTLTAIQKWFTEVSKR